MSATTTSLDQGRAAFEVGAWDEAYVRLTSADHDSSLTPGDLEHAATAAYLTGHDQESDAFWTRAHQEWLRAGEPANAARCGFWLSFLALIRGDAAHSAGWLSRTERLLDLHGLDTVERGYLLLVVGLVELEVATATTPSGRTAGRSRSPSASTPPT